jgi:hypothetical protein
MLKIEFVGLGTTMRALQQQVDRQVDSLGQQIFNEIMATTPVDTGRARQGWRYKKSPGGFVIENQVPYIGVLDQGRGFRDGQIRGSKQAPKGIVTPSLDIIKRRN